jgi:lipopolysaccharide transport system permease protein
MWTGDYYNLIGKLVAKDFKIRYRNMSLGVLWGLINPIVMMSVLTFVFRSIFKNAERNYPIFVFCGLLPFNFFSVAWRAGTNSILDSAGLIKRVPVPREVVPIAAVLACCLDLAIQIGLLVLLVLLFGLGINFSCLWMPVLILLEIVFVTGLSLLTAGLSVVVRDTRYIVESIITVLFWLVPIVYSLSLVPAPYQSLYRVNPLTGLAQGFRDILLEGAAPSYSLMLTMTLVSFVSLGIGWLAFTKLKYRFYDYL